MFQRKNEMMAQPITNEGKSGIYLLVQSYIEYDCKRSRMYTRQSDVDREVQNRLAKIFS